MTMLAQKEHVNSVVAPISRERKLDDICRNDHILLPVKRGKFEAYMPSEIIYTCNRKKIKQAYENLIIIYI